METRANHILIGSFVIGVVLLALGCLLWLGKFGSERDSALTMPCVIVPDSP